MWARGSAGVLALFGFLVFALLSVSVYFASAFGIIAAAALLAVWAFFLVFFRDPERSPSGPGVVSAADGRVRAVGVEDGRLRISVFMNVTDVHVNRFPLDARVESVSEAGHGHRPAYRADAAHNRQRSYTLTTSLGTVEVVQMTGILARRLVTFVAAGEAHHRAERLGMIILGSRVDVLLSADRCEPAVAVGERVWAGSTIIAREKGA